MPEACSSRTSQAKRCIPSLAASSSHTRRRSPLTRSAGASFAGARTSRPTLCANSLPRQWPPLGRQRS
eukprot:278277-Lingulodinium_polyedra.AAC.1